MKKKIVINTGYGGYGLSNKAIKLYLDKKGISYVFDRYFYISKTETFDASEIDRKDSVLIEVIEELGEEANGEYAKLCIMELEEGTLYRIDSYDGSEWIELLEDTQWEIA
jgi:hypothetical protein